MSSSEVVRFPMHRAGHVIGLSDVIDLLEAPPLRWVVAEIEAISEPRSSVDVLELERRVRESSGGVELADDALRDLASSLAQVLDCEVHGFLVTSSGAGAREGAAPAVVVLQAVDSTEWVITLDETVVRLRPVDGLVREK